MRTIEKVKSFIGMTTDANKRLFFFMYNTNITRIIVCQVDKLNLYSKGICNQGTNHSKDKRNSIKGKCASTF